MAFEYVVDGKVINLPVNPDRIAVRFVEPLNSAERRAVIDPKPQVGTFDDRFEVPNEKFTIVDTQQVPQAEQPRIVAAAGALNSDPGVQRVSPVFDLGETQAIATDRILVGFKPETGAKATEIIQDYGGEIIRGNNNEYLVRLDPSVEPFDVVSNLTKRAEVDYAEPDFVTIGHHTPRSSRSDAGLGSNSLGAASTGDSESNSAFDAVDESDSPVSGSDAQHKDPLLPLQYAVSITQSDIAWGRISASSDITIAILDEGVDVSHPDLAKSITSSFDAIDNDSDQQPMPWDAHGTACAGLAAAIPSNNLGIRGMGGGCSLMAIRIAFSKTEGGAWNTTNAGIAAAIDWAWENGADILSNSWGGGTPSTAIINAFERARTQGRNGKGCLIAVAAGNANGPVDFPGNLPNVLTVAASNEFDEPKTMTSKDGETWWGSNFGPEIDIAAPGVHNYTTDISGADGYNAGGAVDADYVSNFNGTSSATPIVAGIAALVLSANPDLRESQVRRVLKESADKVGQVVYTNGRNDKMGFGRVNAARSVQNATVVI